MQNKINNTNEKNFLRKKPRKENGIDRKGESGTFFSKTVVSILLFVAILFVTTDFVIQNSTVYFQNTTAPQRLLDLQGQAIGPAFNVSALGVQTATDVQSGQGFVSSTAGDQLLTPKIVAVVFTNFVRNIPNMIQETISIIAEVIPIDGKGVLLSLSIAAAGIFLGFAALKLFGRAGGL